MSKERKSLIKSLDDYTSWIVRKRDGKCVTCGKPTDYNDKGNPNTNDCSHFLDRAKYITRWDLRNCNCQCKGCHMHFHNRSCVAYYDYMSSHYGVETIIELERLYHTQKKYSIPELRELLIELKEIYRGLE